MNTRGGKTGEQPVTNLAAIVGRWKFEEGRAVFEGPGPELPLGICVSNIRFLEGEARVTIHLSKGLVESRILLGYRSSDHEYYSAGLGGAGGKAYTLVHFNPAIGGWYPLAASGLAGNLPVGRPIEVFVRVRGQRILLEVDGVRVLEHVLPSPLPYGQLGLLTWGDKGEVEFTKFAFLSATRSVPELIRCCFGADNHPTISQWFTNLDEDEKNRRRAFEREFKADLTAFRNLPLSTARHISEHRTGAPPVSVTVTGRFGVTYQGGPTKPIPMTETQKLPDEYAFLEKRTLVRPMWTDFEIDGRPLFETCREYLGSAQALAAKARTLAQQVHGERKLTPPPSDM
jgi:hypothetical protein